MKNSAFQRHLPCGFELSLIVQALVNVAVLAADTIGRFFRWRTALPCLFSHNPIECT